MENLVLKMRLAILWLIWTVTFIVHVGILSLFEPGVIEGIIAGEFSGMQITSELILIFAVLMLVPMVMAFMSLTLKDKVNRWANLVLGIVFTGLCIFDFVGGLAVLPAYSILMFISDILASTLIVWYAYKWKV